MKTCLHRSFVTLGAVLFASVLLHLPVPASAGVRVPDVLGDHMVLQQNTDVTLWGWASVGHIVAVETSWGAAAQTTAESDGSWRVKIKTPPAQPLDQGLHPETVTITMPDENVLQFRDVLIGEVWLCSGQSNMEMMLRPGYPPGWNGWDGEAFWKDEESKKSDRPYLRVYDVEKTAARTPQSDVKGFLPSKGMQPKDAQGFIHGRAQGWQACTPANAEYLSAVAYYFGAALADKLHVPVGLVTSDVGGMPIRAFMEGGDFYNGMVAPFFPMTLQGVIWYQGESNVGDPAGTYAASFKSMIQGWREKFHRADMPFYFVQIAPFGTNPAEAVLRDEQAAALGLKNTGMAVIGDISDHTNVHPKDKRDVGWRLARQALSKTYGKMDVVADGPTIRSDRLLDGSIHLTFADEGGSLMACDDKPLRCFTVAGQDGNFVPAKAEIVGPEIVVTYPPDLPWPTELRFGWGPSDQPNLVSQDGLPAAQFRLPLPAQ